jgi:hypothetical protein
LTRFPFPDFAQVVLRDDGDDDLTGPPSAATIRLKITATNAAGDGPDGAVVETKLP